MIYRTAVQIGWGRTVAENVNTNYFGPRRINEAFGKFVQRPGGRIVNVASASGPNYVSSLPDSSLHKALLAEPWTIPGGVAELDQMSQNMQGEGYGASKALLNAYTVIHAKIEKDLIINSVTPGYIQTDMTAGTSATNPPSKGAIPPCWLMMDDTTVPNVPTGRYYGSDCVRSPLSFYRGPGEPPYDDDEDLVALPESATTLASIL
jgi:carbonyl reductase 1